MTELIANTMNAEDRVLRVWTPILLRTVLGIAAMLLTAGLLASIIHSPSHYRIALQEIQRSSFERYGSAISLMTAATAGDAMAISTLGLFVLTLVPLARVSFCFFLFLKQRSIVFVAFTAYVLAGLVLGILLGRIG
jgi:uncharacterized membrane protein